MAGAENGNQSSVVSIEEENQYQRTRHLESSAIAGEIMAAYEKKSGENEIHEIAKISENIFGIALKW